MKAACRYRADFVHKCSRLISPFSNRRRTRLIRISRCQPADGLHGRRLSVVLFRVDQHKDPRTHRQPLRVPSLYERFGTFYSDFFGYSNTGDSDLAPERSIAFDAGIEQSLLKDRVRLTGTYFYTDITKAIDFAFCVPRCLAFPTRSAGSAAITIRTAAFLAASRRVPTSIQPLGRGYSRHTHSQTARIEIR